jgi:hypothetical protein
MSSFAARLKHEILEAVPPFVYFFIAFHLVAVIRALMQQEYGIQPGTVMNATIAALIVAKVVLLADLVPVVNRFPDKPLVYNIVWKTLIYRGGLSRAVVGCLARGRQSRGGERADDRGGDLAALLGGADPDAVAVPAVLHLARIRAGAGRPADAGVVPGAAARTAER